MGAVMELPKLSEAQAAAVDQLLGGIKRGDSVQRLGGYAGTGKTVVTRSLHKKLGNLYGFCAFTGKAADMMRRKGVSNASTIHSLIYQRIDTGGMPRWGLKRPNEIGVKGFVIDEGSMVSGPIFRDLLTFDLPIVIIGDHGQLPPVGEDLGLMKNPDIVLEEIHRNAGPIAFFAEHLRKGGSAWDWRADGEVVRIVDEIGNVTDYDQVICAMNGTKNALNRKALIELKREDTKPAIGDRVMVLRNNREIGVFNGQQGLIDRIMGESICFNPFYASKVWFRCDPKAWLAEKKPDSAMFGKRTEIVPVDFAWAITAHKSQGDEFDNVAVIEERCRLWEHSRWAYTAASRAKVKLTWRLL